MSKIQVFQTLFDRGDASLDVALEEAHAKHVRPLCMCRNGGVPMYIAHVNGKYITKRMPESGAEHSPACESYEPPPELSGLGEVNGAAIQEDPDTGITTLKFDFVLAKTGSRAAPPPSTGVSDTVRTDGKKLTLRGALHYLWDESGLSRWSPFMEGKRNWFVVRKALLSAAGGKKTKASFLNEVLFIPEAFRSEHADEIKARRLAHFGRVKADGAQKKLLLAIVEVKEFGSARYGFKMLAKQMPDCAFMLNEDIYKRINQRYKQTIDLWNECEGTKLIMVATVSVSAAGYPHVEEAALMLVSKEWIPVDDVYDLELIDRMVQARRRFTKGLRYNLGNDKVLASVVASDTQPVPTAMYLIPPAAKAGYSEMVSELIEASKMQSWTWDIGSGIFPPLPGERAHAQRANPVVAAPKVSTGHPGASGAEGGEPVHRGANPASSGNGDQLSLDQFDAGAV